MFLLSCAGHAENFGRAPPPPKEGIGWGLRKRWFLTCKFSCENWCHLSICQPCFLSLRYYIFFNLEEALYFGKGNKYVLLAIFNPLGRDRLLYNGLKLSYLEPEESVKQWRNTKLLMKTSLTEKEPGRLAEGEENSCVSAIKQAISKTYFSFFLWLQHIFRWSNVYQLEAKWNKAMLWSTDN